MQAAEDLLFAAGAPSKEEAKRQAAIALAIESDVAKSMVTKERMRNIHPVKVSRDRLKEIWQMSCKTNQSFLTRDEFFYALRLIALE